MKASVLETAPVASGQPGLRMSPLLIEVDDVTLQYKTRHHLITAVHGVSFSINQGDTFVLLGPSGCGKSTLLKAVGGFLRPVRGEIRLKGQAVRHPGPDRIMVFQEFDQLLPWKTVKKNVMFPLTVAGVGRREASERADQVIEKVKLTKFAHVHPHMLSGGMKQRVALARGLVTEPAILLMDEPFAALDALTRRTMQEELLQLQEEVGFTVMFVTHSIEEAIRIGSHILVLSPHPGRVRAEFEVSAFGREQEDGPAFNALSQHIRQMLFTERSETVTKQ
jgi:NitT/TauT family transport system ATP-binding protein